MGRALLLVAVAGCSFSPSVGQQPSDDAPTDTVPATCEDQGDHVCDGRSRLECGPDHQWLPEAVVCDFTCVGGACIDASNVPASEVAACDDTAPPLAPTTGSVTLTAPGGQIKLTCSDGCGDGRDEILATKLAGSPGLGWFCLRSLDLPAGVTMGIPTSGGPAEAIAFVVDGAISIAGNIGVDGKPATMGAAGEGAPGAGDGGGPAADNGGTGNLGAGSGGGLGGNVAGGVNNFAAGGGGGGGHGVDGGPGGGGQSPMGTTTTGGAGGPMFDGLSPLIGGGGGGGGGDGSCGGACGWPGGGGGGAIQLSSRASIAISGQLRARGGDGFGLAGNAGGAGGGGAGGTFVLEAPTITLAGTVTVDGGNGGPSGGGNGGAGATGASSPTPGATGNANSEGGAGGGGAGGRVSVRAAAASCGTVSPQAACIPLSLP